MNPRFVQSIKFQTSSLGIGSTDTSIILNSFKLPDGTAITTSDFGTTGFGCIAPGTEKEESISFTGVTQNADGTATLTGVTRGLAFVHPYSGSSSRAYDHGRSDFVLSNTAAFYGNLRSYIDSVAVSGASNADDSTKGIVEIANSSEIDANTATGGTGAALAISPDQLDLSKYGTQLPSSDQKAALAGTSGTPSSSNKYVTNADTTGTGDVLRESAVTNWVQELFVPVTARYDNGLGSLTYPYDAQTANFPISVIGSSEKVYFSFKVPSDFTTLSEVSVIIIPDASETIQFDVSTTYSSSTQTYSTHTGSASNQTQAVTVSIMTKVDINLGTCFSSLAANDFLTINFNSDTSSLQVVGLLFKYS